MFSGKLSESFLADQGDSLVAVFIAHDVVERADLTTAARGRWAKVDSSSEPCLDSREVTLPVTSLLSTEIGTLSLKMSLIRDILEAKGR